MRNIIVVEKIQSTPTYQDLVKRKELVKMKMLETRAEREKITNAFQIHKNTGKIPEHITGAHLQIVKDLIVLEEIDRARMFVNEPVVLMNGQEVKG